jgi:magnesium and cobalt transporter
MEELNTVKKSAISRFFSFLKPRKADLREAVEEVIKEHVDDESFPEEEREILENFLQFSAAKVSEIMIPRTDIKAVTSNANYEEVHAAFTSHGHTRLPVYRDNIDNIIGFIHMKDFICLNIEDKDSFNVIEMMRNILYAPRSQRCFDMLAQMRASAVNIAVVLDEYGGTDGIITVEDLISEIVGEIPDEHDTNDPDDVVEVSRNTYIVEGRSEIEDIEEKLGVSLSDEEGNYETFGGFLMSYLGRVPQTGEVISHPSGIKIEIKDADERRIKTARVQVFAHDERSSDI